MKPIIQQLDIHFFYTLTHGGPDLYHFDDKDLWSNCKTIKHCVFETTCKEGDFYVTISESLNKKHGTPYPVIPHMIDLPDTDDNLRSELNIPEGAIVLGRYGGNDQFNIPFVHDAIRECVGTFPIYFLFMNTTPFYHHPNIIYLPRNLNSLYKTRFINTCDAMLHARSMGETFGLSIAEFSSKNKPIITCNCGDLEHLKILDDAAIVYNNKSDLLRIFADLPTLLSSRTDWNKYSFYTPKNIMWLFEQYIFSSL